MAKLGIFTVIAAFCGLLASTQVAAAESLTEIGITASSVIALGWLGLLSLLAIAIILPLVKH